jgi:hypothetical protein
MSTGALIGCITMGLVGYIINTLVVYEIIKMAIKDSSIELKKEEQKTVVQKEIIQD